MHTPVSDEPIRIPEASSEGDDDDDLIGLPDAEPFPLLDRVPPALRGVILEVAWDVDLLRQLDLPVVDVELADLRWQLELPWWTHEGHPFAISPTQVRADPARYPGHRQRVLDADLYRPIYVMERSRGLVVMDGVHRLAKADELGWDRILAHRVQMRDIAKVLVR